MTRTYVARLAAAALSCAALIACSAAHDEPGSGATSEAVSGKCPPGQVRDPDGDYVLNGKIVHVCIPAESTPTYSDVCGPPNTVPVPGALYTGNGFVPGTTTCQPGILVNGYPVWVCRADTVVPRSIGVVSSGQGPCYDAQGRLNYLDKELGTCEATWTGTHLKTNCLSDPPAGYILVADLQFKTYCGGQGGCPGGCAVQHDPPGPFE